MKTATLLLALLTLTAAPAYAQMYKCGSGENVTYQEKPCDGGQKLSIRKAPEPGSREERVENAIARKQVFIGMLEAEVVRAWGKPDRINRSVTARTVSEQWIYERDRISDSQYLYLENDVLRSLQTPR